MCQVAEFIRRFRERSTPGEDAHEMTFNGCIISLRPSQQRAAHVELCSIRALARRCGHGTITMLALCELADELGIAIELEPSPYGSTAYMTRMDLKHWYWGFGFTDLYRPLMVRFPRELPCKN